MYAYFKYNVVEVQFDREQRNVFGEMEDREF